MALADVVAQVRDLLGDEPWEDDLTSAITSSSSTSMNVAAPTGWEEGDSGEFPDGEQVRVEAPPTSNPVTIKRAHNGTTAATHASGDRLTKNPRFSQREIEQAVSFVVDSLWPSLWEIKTTTITPAPSTKAVYDLPSDYESFEELSQKEQGAITDVLYITDVREVQNVPTSVASTGRGLRILSWARTDVDATLTYRAKITTGTSDARLQRVLALGTARKLAIKEAFSKANRRDDEGRTQIMLSTANFLYDEFEAAKQSYRSEALYASPPKRRFIGVR